MDKAKLQDITPVPSLIAQFELPIAAAEVVLAWGSPTQQFVNDARVAYLRARKAGDDMAAEAITRQVAEVLCAPSAELSAVESSED